MAVSGSGAAGGPVPVVASGPERRPASGAFPAAGLIDERQRQEDLRTATYLMLFRVVLASVLLIGMVSVLLSTEDPTSIDSHFVAFCVALLVTTYGVTVVYALVLRHVKRPIRFAYAQIGIDLLMVTLLVHATGGGQSAFTFLYMIQVVAVALLPQRHGAAWVALVSALMLVTVSLLGYLHLLPTVPGQPLLPWETTRIDLLVRLVLNLAAVAGVGGLSMLLASQNQRTGERLARHQRYAGDLASLHQNTIRCLSSGLVTVTPDGLVTSINEAASEILGLDEETSAIGMPLATRIPGLQAMLEEVGPVGSVRRHEIDALRPDGSTRRLGISATPLSDHTGRIIGRVIHFQDLTELRQMEVQVERSERLATIGRLAAGIAHEIRNPLASISGSVEILKALPGADGETRQLVDIAVREVDRLNQLITELLDYARPRTEERRPVDLGEVATEIAKAFEQERKGAPIRIRVEAAAAVVLEAAAGQIRQVLWNLVRNAAEAMPQGGTATIRVARETSAGGEPMAVLAVSDDGVGIKADDLEHIFEPFFTSKTRGTGLGLATVARIVEDHRGTIETDSTPGRGTVFTLRFPLSDAELPARAAGQTPQARAR